MFVRLFDCFEFHKWEIAFIIRVKSLNGRTHTRDRLSVWAGRVIHWIIRITQIIRQWYILIWKWNGLKFGWTIRLTLSPGVGGGVLPYITYTGMCRPKGSWFWSSWFRTGYPFHTRFLERGIIFRTHESSTFVSSHLKVFRDRLLLKIRFNALTSKPLYSCCTLERSIKNWPISRTGYQF